MKKFLACIVAVCCLLSLGAFSANAVTSNEVEIDIAVSDAYVTVNVSTNFACGGLQGALVYDSDNLQFTGADVSDAIAEFNSIESSVSDSNGKTRIALVGDVANGTNGNWLTITYTANNGLDVEFSANSFKVFDVEGKLVDANVEITKDAGNVLRGDANDDGKLNICDLVEMGICKDSQNIDASKIKRLDFNEDGSWDFNTDMPDFRKYLLEN